MIWTCLYDNMGPLFLPWFTIIIVLLSEFANIPFIIFDIKKMFPKNRIHYSKKYDRPYPTHKDIMDGIHALIMSYKKVLLPIMICGFLFLHITGLQFYVITRELPNWREYIRDVILLSIMGDVLFYVIHRIFHIPYLYKRFHKQHHYYNLTFSLVNHYVHPFELAIFVIPAALPPILLNVHLYHMWHWAFWANVHGIYTHSGYIFPISKLSWFPIFHSEEHDAHHYVFTKNYGAMFNFMDKLCGTYYKADITYFDS